MQDRTAEICKIIEAELLASKGLSSLSTPVTADSQMGNPKEWDSLAFVAVFLKVSEHFAVDVEDEDAVHFTSIASIKLFLEEVGI